MSWTLKTAIHSFRLTIITIKIMTVDFPCTGATATFNFRVPSKRSKVEVNASKHVPYYV